jgi:hypothetical protein
MKKVILVTYAVCFVAFLAQAANAKTLTFTWSGSEPVTGVRGTGTGTFTFPDGLTSVRMTDLTKFSFTETEDETECGLCHGANPNGPFTSTFTLGLANLTNFSLTLVNGAPTGFTLQTDEVDGPAFRVFEFSGDTVGGFFNAVGAITFKP